LNTSKNKQEKKISSKILHKNYSWFTGGDSHGAERLGVRGVDGGGDQEHVQFLGPVSLVACRRYSYWRHTCSLFHLVKVTKLI
jgi:hypothetical protein